MKMKHFLAALAAVFTLGFTVSCDDDSDPTLLDEVQVSSSYVAIPVAGGQSKITVNATESWSITGMPDWLTVSPASGNAGSSEVTFSAAAYEGRSAEVYLECGINTQRINVIQGIAQVANASVKDVMAGPDSKTYRVTGVVTKITETATYGNWYINDGTVSGDGLYIYGTKYEGKTKQAALIKLGIEIGDEVTIEGPKTTYNGTVELVDVDVVKVNKSLIKCDSLSASSFSSDGGVFTAYLTNKGQGLYVDVPEHAQSWLSIQSVSGNEVTFAVAPNTAGPRVVTLVFKTTDGKKWYTAETSISQDGLSGTLDVPFTVSEAIAYCNKVGGDSPKEYYVKGIVTKVQSQYSAAYGNATFWISDDGTCSVSEDGKSTSDTSHDFEVYRALWFNNQKWADGNCEISVGDEVVICGTLTLYKGISETVSGKAYVYSVNGCTTDENGLGSLSAPFNAVGAITAAKAGVNTKVYVQGIVSELVKGGFDANYGNGSFWISTDGVYHADKSLDFEAYQVNWLEGAKWNAETDPQIKVGDRVTLYGPLTTYNGTSETQGKGAAYVYEYNK